MKAIGCTASPELIAAHQQPAEAEVEVWPDMADSVGLFLASGSQWRWVGVGMAGAMRTGLDLPAVIAIGDRLEISVTPRVLADLKIMEGEAAALWGKKR